MKKRGFTIIELMIVLVIIGILSLISYPVYTGHLLKVRRSYMAVALMDLAGKLESHYILKDTYKGVVLEKGDENYNQYYKLEKKIEKDKYILKAVPINGQAKDAACGSLTIDQDGNKGAVGSGDVVSCWL